ncbi:ORF6N domain-containing protein [Elusimicrobiota bacterium]
MGMETPTPMVLAPEVQNLIYLIRGHRVMLDADLARLYEVETKALNRAVKRNEGRFPQDFAFRLTADEEESLRCQIGTSKKGRGGRRNLPLAFTEQGVAMLSGVLTSERAVRVNVAIMRAFVRLRQMVSVSIELAAELAELERKIESHDESIRTLFEAIRELMEPPVPQRPSIGFKPKSE